MENTNGFPQCTGCGACVQVCPVPGAISLAANREGFYCPVTTDVCIHCGACRKACPEQSFHSLRSGQYETFWAARHRESAVVRQSSSGGAFTALAQAVLAQGGVVYGVVWQGAQAIYRRAQTLAEVEAMRGSKYIQTAPCPLLDETFVQDAAAGTPVLFTGLSCKISGMRRLLAQRKVSADTVWFVDFVCTGVISPLLWQRERERYEQQYGSLVSYNFRDKCTGWQDYSLSVQLQMVQPDIADGCSRPWGATRERRKPKTFVVTDANMRTCKNGRETLHWPIFGISRCCRLNGRTTKAFPCWRPHPKAKSCFCKRSNGLCAARQHRPLCKTALTFPVRSSEKAFGMISPAIRMRISANGMGSFHSGKTAVGNYPPAAAAHEGTRLVAQSPREQCLTLPGK